MKPGSTIWLRGGTYGNGGTTIFNSKLVGEPDKPITIRAYPGERPIIDGSLMVYREWTVFWGLEVFSSDPNRISTIEGSHPQDISRTVGINVLAPNTKFINNIVHDQGEGFGFWKEAINSELYGNIVYNNGWQGPDRGHGYSIYAQNQEGTKLISDNITFNNFGEYGVHVYGESIDLLGFLFEGNVNFNGKFLIGGLQPAGDITLVDNYFYRGQVQFGYRNQNNRDITLKNNYFGSQASDTLTIKWWQDLDVSGNRIWNDTTKNVSFLYPDTPGSYLWDNNGYYAPGNDAFVLDNAPLSLDQWKNTTGFDQNSSFTTGSPSGVDVFIRPNKYEANRANIIIYNWDEKGSVSVDISNLGLRNGQKYVLHNTQNYLNETIEGTYDGKPIDIPMTGWSIVKPIGWNEPLQPSTFPQFGVFLLIGK